MTETGYDSSPNKRKASRRARGMVERFAKRRLPGTHRGMERMEAIPLWHGRGISRDLIERLRIFESIRRCVNSGSVSPARHTCPCFWTRRKGREGGGRAERYGWKGTIKIFARARAYRGFGQPRFFSFFFFLFFFPLVRVARVVWLYRVSCCIWWIEVYICYVKMIKKEEEEGKRKRAQVFDFAFEFINESLVRQAALHYPRRGLFKMIFVDRFIFGPYFWIRYCIFYWKLCLIF